nr:AIR synthase family protein [bacterium]
MRLGKLSNPELQALVLDYVTPKRGETLTGAGIGEDCAAIRLGEEICVVSTDPITAAGQNAGTLAVHISCNDAASAGAQPLALLVTLLMPPQSQPEDIRMLASQLQQAAAQAGVDIVGGHTEVTDAVVRPVISTTVIARAPKGGMIKTAGMQAGDSLVMTKTCALEGTSILASDYAPLLQGVLDPGALARAQGMIGRISVVTEGMIAAACPGTHAMHDITEGGVLGAAWEMADASQTGLWVDAAAVPVAEETKTICAFFGIDPYRLIGSGSLLIATAAPDALVRALAEGGVQATVIGRATPRGEGMHLADGQVLSGPESDELYRAAMSAKRFSNGE